MILAPALVALIHQERTEEIRQARRATLAARVRSCCTASTSLVQRIARVFRAEPIACQGC